MFFLFFLLFRLNKTGGLGWWFGVGGKAFFCMCFLIFSNQVIMILKPKKYDVDTFYELSL